MLHPHHFRVKEAWIAFRLNRAPIRTDRDGDFNVLALVDAASCYILGMRFVATTEADLSSLEAQAFLQEGRAHRNQLPSNLFIPEGEEPAALLAAAERAGITVIRVPGNQLLGFIGEVREDLEERFGSPRTP